MHQPAKSLMNWDDTRIFLAVQRERSLRAAARVLGIDQATVGRRLALLEKTLGATLFLRSSQGYSLTAAGELALQAALEMENAAQALVSRTQGSDQRLAGEVRLATTDSLALALLLPALKVLNGQHPDIKVNLNISPQLLNMAKREADIAVRTIKPDNPDLLTRRLASWPVGLYASKEYLASRGEPARGSAFAGHDLVVFEPHLHRQEPLTLGGESIAAGRIVSSHHSSLTLRSAISVGFGLGEVPIAIAERDGLIRVWPERQRARPYEVWLVTHQDLRHTARIDAVIHHIVSAFAAWE
ncbi:LysR family transcriptional regulator [Gallaecimonas xiamenensis]